MKPQKAEVNNSLVIDTIIVILGVLLIGTVAWSFYQIRILTAEIDTNKMHTCWLTEYQFGLPETTSREACDGMREQLGQWWDK
tara:strand:+ start:914 stop:1162 length:249 start_codon:yes stop_codon:yes gene_type:complete